jgi:mannose-6-phosphate isomerase-like protein (cupin superfamily)
MGLRRRVEIIPVERTVQGPNTFFEAQNSDETLISQIADHHWCEIFCHRRQTDQLMVLRGAIDLVVLQDGRLRRIVMREDDSSLVRIPPGVPHGAINRGSMPAVLVNAVLRHGPNDPRDYKARQVPEALASQLRRLLLPAAPGQP